MVQVREQVERVGTTERSLGCKFLESREHAIPSSFPWADIFCFFFCQMIMSSVEQNTAAVETYSHIRI